MKRGYICGKNVDFITQAIKPGIPNHCRYVHDRRNEGILLVCDRQRSVASPRKTLLRAYAPGTAYCCERSPDNGFVPVR